MTQGPISQTIAKTFSPPVMEARRWLEGVTFPPERPLLNLSQAAPVDPPTAALRDAMVAAVAEDDSHIYGPVLGLPTLRTEIAEQWSALYGGKIATEQLAIPSGCNQAFCAVSSQLPVRAMRLFCRLRGTLAIKCGWIQRALRPDHCLVVKGCYPIQMPRGQ